MATLRITQVKSTNGTNPRQKGALRSLKRHLARRFHQLLPRNTALLGCVGFNKAPVH